MSDDIRLIPFGISSTTGTLTTPSQVSGLEDDLAFVRMISTGLPPSVTNFASLAGTHNAIIELNNVSQFTAVNITIASINAVTVPATIPLTNGTQRLSYTITQSMVTQLTTNAENTVQIGFTITGATGTIQTFNGIVFIDSTVSGDFDENAIHDDVAGEINAITEKTSVVDDDILIIEDSEDSFNKKKVLASNVGTGGGGTTPTQQEFIRVRPSASQTLNSTADTEITFVTVDQNTNESRFTVTSGDVNVLQASRYLINVKTSIDSSETDGSQRADPRTRVRVNDTKVGPSTYGHYARNSQGTPMVTDSSDTLTFVMDLSANDTVDVVLEVGDETPLTDVDTIIDGTYLEIIELVGVQGIQGQQGPAGVDGGIDAWGGLTGTIDNAEITSTLESLNFVSGTDVEVFKATNLTTGLEESVQLPTNYTDFRNVHITQIDDSEVRTKTFPISLLTDTNITSSTVIRMQGDTDITFDNSNRTITTGDSTSNLYRVVLEVF